MISTNILNPMDQQAIALKMLSAFGLQKTILKHLGGQNQDVTNPYWKEAEPVYQKCGTGWLQNRLSGVIVDRVIRVYESIYGDIQKERVISAVVLANVALAYFCCYPKDNLGITRMYELLIIINSGGSDGREAQINIEDAPCTDCGQRYHVHMKLTRRCSACQIRRDLKEDPKLLEKLKREIYHEEGNLKGVQRGSLKDYIDRIKIERAQKAKQLERCGGTKRLAG